ncbi:camphor resistance protein CrcB [Sporosarcina pasteurii]|uniref:Fluoride-specific ion channel FluC n=2 Tax=Sporosarcina pasteurii TaxID=1474 RepID=A0A380C8M0_SPOPA|nr:camphor resistance protein CrcB [Sporosarcina pasteurii]
MVGAILRTSIGHLVGEGSSFPITFTANMVATWLLCFFAAGVLAKIIHNPQIREAITVGFLGSFSTFSALSMETVLLIENGQIVTAVSYVLASVIGGIAVGLFGFHCGRKLVSP